MKKTLILIAGAIIVMMLAGLAQAETLNGAGASFPFPVYSAWGYEYNKVTGIRLNYQSIGSGGGQRQIMARTVDFGASDAPLPPEKLDKNGLLQFPAVIGGVVPVINIKGIGSGALNLDQATLCGIFLGDIQKWDDKRIIALNPALKLPSMKITVVHRSDGSGTTAIYTTYLATVCKDWKDRVGAGNAVKWPVGIGGKGNEGVANYVKRSKNSIGYVEFAYAKQNRLTYIKLKNSAGNYMEPSFESFKAAAASADFNPERHFNLWLVDSPGKGSWPIAGATFILLDKEKADTNRSVVRFFDWAYVSGDKTAERLVYVPLPDSLKETIRVYWKKNGIF